MGRFFVIVYLFTVLLVMLCTPAASGQDSDVNPCLKCHEDVYVKAISFRYKHSVVRDQCPVCHIYAEEKEEVAMRLDFPSARTEWLLNLDRLQDGQAYQAEVVLRDDYGNESAAYILDIADPELLTDEQQRTSYSAQSISNLKVDEILKRAFAQATISWDTDGPATSEIEFGVKGERVHRFKKNSLYTRHHRVTLNTLKHKSVYGFQAVSSDIYGNTVKSGAHILDTSLELPARPGSSNDERIPPSVKGLQAFRIEEDDGIYLEIRADKPGGLSLVVRAMDGTDQKHGSGLVPAHYSRIDVCVKCHPHDSSHPVGVKAESPKTRTPEGLPTIDDEIITCVTCHAPHGGERIYFSRFDYNKDLCMKCHLQKYSM